MSAIGMPRAQRQDDANHNRRKTAFDGPHLVLTPFLIGDSRVSGDFTYKKGGMRGEIGMPGRCFFGLFLLKPKFLARSKKSPSLQQIFQKAATGAEQRWRPSLLETSPREEASMIIRAFHLSRILAMVDPLGSAARSQSAAPPGAATLTGRPVCRRHPA